jgi:hypothetical protein
MHAQSAVLTLVASVTATTGAAGGVTGATGVTGCSGVVAGVVAVAFVVTTGTVVGMANPANAVSGRFVLFAGRCFAVCADAACRLVGVKIPVVNPVMTAIAAVSAMRIRTAPPFVGRVIAPGSARWGRAPAVAYAPRTESGKASSVLA